jgi:hypothetical protein
MATSPKVEEMIGHTFGYLKVLRLVGTNKWRARVYECICLEIIGGRKCSNLHRVVGHDLKSGNTSRCLECFKRKRRARSRAYYGWLYSNKNDSRFVNK